MAKISNEEKLRRLFSLLDEDGLTNETFAKQFKMVVNFVKKIEAKNILHKIEQQKKLRTKRK